MGDRAELLRADSRDIHVCAQPNDTGQRQGGQLRSHALRHRARVHVHHRPHRLSHRLPEDHKWKTLSRHGPRPGLLIDGFWLNAAYFFLGVLIIFGFPNTAAVFYTFAVLLGVVVPVIIFFVLPGGDEETAKDEET